jgi:hypothetical protein
MKFGRIEVDATGPEGEGGDMSTLDVTVQGDSVCVHAFVWDVVQEGILVPLDAARARKLAEMLVKAAAWAGAE